MVKFGKKFNETKISDWKEKYLDYKALKQMIKKFRNEKETNKEEKSIEEKEEILNKYINEFTGKLDKEIRKIYIFFTKNEKILYKDINKILHIKEEYFDYELSDYLKQLLELKRISKFSLDISQYIYYNLKALLKILKKFDKRVIGIKNKNNHIKNNYIVAKLEDQNSDILYLINFKMLDEVNVILENLVSCLKDSFKNNKSQFQSTVVSCEEIQDSKTENLLNSSNITNNQIDLNKASDIIEEAVKAIKKNIQIIDNTSTDIMGLFLTWKKFLRISGDVGGRLIQLNKELNSINDNEEEKKNPYKKGKSIIDSITFSKQNYYNIILTLIHSFLYMFSFSIIIPDYVKLINIEFDKSEKEKNSHIYYGLLMIMAPLGAIISYFYESRVFKISTKCPFTFSCLGLFAGNLLYWMSIDLDLKFFLFFGRFLIGCCNLRTHNKMYILNFLLKKDVSYYLTMFHTFSILGLAVGFLINIFFTGLDETSIINKYNIEPFLAAIFCLVLFVLSIIFFTDAHSPKFNITSMKSSHRTNSLNDFENIDNIDIGDNNNCYEGAINDDCSKDIKKTSDMLSDLNSQLGDFNRMSKFDDTNMVSVSISELAYKEREGLHSLFSSFFIYLIIIFTTKFISESIFINLPIFKEKEANDYNISLVCGLSCLISLGIEYALKHKNKFISEKKFLIILFTLDIIDAIALIILNEYHLDIVYFLFIGLTIVLINSTEKYSTHFFFNIIPEDYMICKLQGNLIINILGMLSKILCSVLIMLFSQNENYTIIILSIFTALCSVCGILFWIFYSDLRIKAISKIMNKLMQTDIKLATEI